jgi:hypothetical protein
MSGSGMAAKNKPMETRTELVDAIFSRQGVEPTPANELIRKRCEQLPTRGLVNLILDTEAVPYDSDTSAIMCATVAERAGTRPVAEYLREALARE